MLIGSLVLYLYFISHLVGLDVALEIWNQACSWACSLFDWACSSYKLIVSLCVQSTVY